jgi:hypothetical protein
MDLKKLHAEIANHCGQVARLFRPGVKVTILVRSPAEGDADVLVTDDQIDAAIAALAKLKEQEAKLARAGSHR